MRPLFQTLCLCVVLALGRPDEPHLDAKLDRCEGIEFDAITPDEKGITFFFKGDHLWKGFHGPSELLNSSFQEMDSHHHLAHVDAAFRMHQEDHEDHDHIFLFQDDKVFSYYNHTLESGFPKDIEEVFPGIPTHLDAAVECPKGECVTDSVIFFKENKVYHFDIKTKAVKQRNWAHLPNCTAAYRWLERHYCFHGHQFTKFHPVTGSVVGKYPKDTRNYFMRCPKFDHGSDATERERCSHVHLDAITTDDLGKAYAFRGSFYMRLDTHRDGWHAFAIADVWKDVKSDLDAVFSYDDKLYMIKGDQVYIYKSAAHYTLIQGYPKTLKEELGIEGHVDAAFVCGEDPTVHVIQGQKMRDVDLSATPRAVAKESHLPFPKIDAAMCGPDGVKVFVGPEYYQYETPMLLAFSRIRPEPHKISLELLGCDH
ncbi:hemopexin-like [Megalops cyprinoides]|uniref:hemopexin-like n=1 Tax=Megalops cyprinoides TaxID=118141 RepID=UPI0018651F35|nr:hemopexin-like [Megalops cyprinoides]